MTKREIPLELLGDLVWAAALFILSSQMFVNSVAWKHVDLKERSIYFDEMLKYGWSGGERRMLRLAASIFNQDLSVNLWEELGNLDLYNARVVIKAIGLFMGVTVSFNA